MKAKMIRQKDLTAECWMIQFVGLSACATCEYNGTPDCGGQRIKQELEEKGRAGKVTTEGLPDARTEG